MTAESLKTTRTHTTHNTAAFFSLLSYLASYNHPTSPDLFPLSAGSRDDRLFSAELVHLLVLLFSFPSSLFSRTRNFPLEGQNTLPVSSGRASRCDQWSTSVFVVSTSSCRASSHSHSPSQQVSSPFSPAHSARGPHLFFFFFLSCLSAPATPYIPTLPFDPERGRASHGRHEPQLDAAEEVRRLDRGPHPHHDRILRNMDRHILGRTVPSRGSLLGLLMPMPRATAGRRGRVTGGEQQQQGQL